MNAALLGAIEEACDAFEAGTLSIAELQEALEEHGASLEGMDRKVFAALHDMSNDLERIQFACRLDEQFAKGVEVANRLRDYVRDLDGRSLF